MKVKSQRDCVAGTLFTLIGIGFTLGATSYSFGSSIRPGPGYFPFFLGIALTILGCCSIFESLVKRAPLDSEKIGPIAWLSPG